MNWSSFYYCMFVLFWYVERYRIHTLCQFCCYTLITLVSFQPANRLHLNQSNSWQCIPSVVILIQINSHFSPSFLPSAISKHGHVNGYLCSFLLIVDVGAYCRKWIESQSDVCVRPRKFISLLWPIVSPETKEAIDKGIEKIEEIPKFYLDAEKKEKKEKDKHKEYGL